MANSAKATYWILTIPEQFFDPLSDLNDNVAFITGQLEEGEQQSTSIGSIGDISVALSQEFGGATQSNPTTGYRHWQIMVIFKRQVRLTQVRAIFGPYHAEPTRSKAAESYCHKESTRVEGTEFTLGIKPLKRNDSKDWDLILGAAKSGEFESIPADVLIRNYGNLVKISVAHARPVAQERQVRVYWGPTGTGKSRTAWEEATLDAYPKDPMSKFWDGYRGQANVVIDEFRGSISISHLLRWLDRYPVLVEVKGSSTVFKAERIWITSNLHPRRWYPDLDEVTYLALERRLEIIEKNFE